MGVFKIGVPGTDFKSVPLAFSREGRLMMIYPVRYQVNKKIEIAQALSEDAEDDLIVGLFVTMNKHVPERCHVLEGR